MGKGIHYLKSHPQSFQKLLDGVVSHDLRQDDRDYESGDDVVLCEWDPDRGEQRVADGYTGRELRRKILEVRGPSVLPDGALGDDYVVLCLEQGGRLHDAVVAAVAVLAPREKSLKLAGAEQQLREFLGDGCNKLTREERQAVVSEIDSLRDRLTEVAEMLKRALGQEVGEVVPFQPAPPEAKPAEPPPDDDIPF